MGSAHFYNLLKAVRYICVSHPRSGRAPQWQSPAARQQLLVLIAQLDVLQAIYSTACAWLIQICWISAAQLLLRWSMRILHLTPTRPARCHEFNDYDYLVANYSKYSTYLARAGTVVRNLTRLVAGSLNPVVLILQSALHTHPSIDSCRTVHIQYCTSLNVTWDPLWFIFQGPLSAQCSYLNSR